MAAQEFIGDLGLVFQYISDVASNFRKGGGYGGMVGKANQTRGITRFFG